MARSLLNSPNQSDLGSDINSAGNNGRLIPGNWIAAAPFPAGCNNAPCFQPNVGPCIPGNGINAFRVELNLDSSGIRTLFARIVKQDKVIVNSTATATSSPRHGIFGTDLSASVTWASHPPSGARRFAYHLIQKDLLTPNVTDCPLIQNIGNANSGGQPCLDLYNPSLPVSLTNQPRCLLGSSLTDEWYSLGLVSPDLRTNYRCFTFQFVDNGMNAMNNNPTGTTTESYLIDVVTTPQPLSAILRGINRGLQLFQARSVAGDLVSLVGFDSDILGPTGPPFIRKIPLTPPINGTAFDSMINITAGTWPNIPLLQAMMFPRPTAQADTNVPLWLLDNLNQFDTGVSAQFPGASRFVVLASDMFSNCSNQVQQCPSPNNNPNWAGWCCGANSPGSINGQLVRSQNQLIGIISAPAPARSYAQRKIPIHSLFFGTHHEPNTKVLPSTGQGCMSEAEWRNTCGPLLGTNSANPAHWWTNWSTAITNSPFSWSRPNVMHFYLGVGSGGLWQPIRPCCAVSTTAEPEGGTQCKDVAADLANSCDAAEPSLPLGYNPCTVQFSVNPSNFDSGANLNNLSSGKLTCETGTSNEQKQVLDAIEKIMGQSPYVLVE